MESKSFNEHNKERILLTLDSVLQTIENLIDWNKGIDSVNDFYSSPGGMQLLAANCTLIMAIGEAINRINRLSPDFLRSYFPEIPWIDIVGMRNHIAHGYFELDADIVFCAVKNDVPPLQSTIRKAIEICKL